MKKCSEKTKENIKQHREVCNQINTDFEKRVSIKSISHRLTNFLNTIDLSEIDFKEFIDEFIPIRKTLHTQKVLRHDIFENYFEDYIDEEWLRDMDTYIMNLSKEDLFNVFGYTLYGDGIVNHYIRGSFEIHHFYNQLTTNYKITYRNVNYFPLFFPALHRIQKTDSLDLVLRHDKPFKLHLSSDPSVISTLNNIFSMIKNTGTSLKSKYEELINIAPNLDYELFWKHVIEDYKHSLQKIIQNSPSTRKPMYLYRGVRDQYVVKDFKNNRLENIHLPNSFMSTSSTIYNAHKFAHSDCCLMRILAPTGSKCLFISGVSKFNKGSTESEFLLGYDTTLKIVRSKYQTLCNYYNTMPNKFNKDNFETHKMYVTDLELVPNNKKIVSHHIPDTYIQLSHEQLLEEFKKYFESDILEVILNSVRPKFRCAVSGGYGLKQLLHHKYNQGDVITTNDIDITVSVKDSSMNKDDCMNYILNKANEFVKFAKCKKEDIDIRKFSKNIDVKMGCKQYTLYYLIIINYKGKEFIDISITNQDITYDTIDFDVSLRASLPIKKQEYYLLDYLQLLYASNVPGVYPYIYQQRNIVSGVKSDKGKKDIERGKLLCDKNKLHEYKFYCDTLLKNIDVTTFKNMSQSDRDKYFSSLEEIV